MEKYVVQYNDIKNGNCLLYNYKTIEGNNPKDAIKKALGVDVERLTGDNGRYANIILVKGYYDNETNSIHYTGRYQQLCYGLKEVLQ